MTASTLDPDRLPEAAAASAASRGSVDRHAEYDRRRLALMEGLIRGESLEALLRQLVADHESLHRPSLCSILLLNEDGLTVRVATAPSLPDFYNAAINGQRTGPHAGSCGAAIHSGQRVVVEDIEHHPNWTAYLPVTRQAGLRACWSEPIMGPHGRALGSFAVYRREVASPGADELEHLAFAAQLAALAITHIGTVQRLRDSERRTRDILRTIPDAVWMKDLQGRYIDCNVRFEQLVGRPLASIQGQTDLLLPASARQALQAVNAQALDSGKAVSVELWLDLPGQAGRGLFEVVKTPVFDPQERLAGLLGVARDVTLIRQGAQAIAEQERLIDTMFSQTTDAIVLLDPQSGQFVTFNDAAWKSLGYTRLEFGSMCVSDIQAEHTADQVAGHVARALAGETVTFETRHHCADGRLQDAVVTLRQVMYSGRTLISAVWRDITAAKQREARLARLNRSYAVLSGVNEAIVRQRDAAQLFAQVCRVAVDAGAFALAWIGQLSSDGRSIVAVARAGARSAYVEALHIALDSEGPSALAWTSGRAQVVADVDADPRMRLWRERAHAYGFRASAAFPVRVGGATAAVLNVYASDAGHFDVEQVTLFERLAQDLGYALAFMASEQAQRQDRAFRDQLIESVAGLFFALDAQGRLVLWNRRVEEVTGHAHHEIAGRLATSCFDAEDRARLAQAIALALDTGQARVEASVLTRDGRRQPYLFESRRVVLGSSPLVVGTGIDISERVRSEAELDRYRQHLEALVASRTAELEAVNARLSREDRRLRAMLDLSRLAAGLSEEELCLEAARRVSALTDSPRVCLLVLEPGPGPSAAPHPDVALAGLSTVVDTGAAPDAATLADVPAWTHAQEVLASARAVRVEAGAPGQGSAAVQRSISIPVGDATGARLLICAANLARPYAEEEERELGQIGADLWNILERRRMELALVLAKRSADAANQAKSAFLANMSHEIRTPMNAIMGFAHLLRREPLTPRQGDFLGKILASSQHLLQVINDILDYSKIEAQKVSLECHDFALRDAVQRVVEMAQASRRDQAVALTLEVSSHCPLRVCGDRLRLEQVLLNLVGNALKFTEHGSVAVRVMPTIAAGAERACSLRFEVVDTGIGIAPAQLPHLFQAFEQADSSTTRRFGGTGLGLAICKRLVRLMGGTIGVDSQPGAGSRFWFELPLAGTAAGASAARLDADPAPPVPQPALPAPGERRLGGAHVLLVEDNPLNQEVGVNLLRALGVHADVAGDGEQAVRMVEQSAAWPYELVLMDLQMPVMDGLQASRAIRALPGGRALPIIAMTASAFAEDRSRCDAAGMDDFLVKPVVPEQLRDCLLRWLPLTAPTAAVAWAAATGSAADDALARLERAGLDVGSALGRLHGDRALLLHTLQRFVQHHQGDGSAMRTVLGRDADDPQFLKGSTTLRAMAHTLGSVAGTLGALRLQRRCQALELATVQGQPFAEVRERVEATHAELAHVVAVACTALAAGPGAGHAHGGAGHDAHAVVDPVVRAQALSALETLATLLASHDIAAIEMLERLHGQLCALSTTRAAQLDEQLQVFDFGAALELALRWIEELGATPA